MKTGIILLGIGLLVVAAAVRLRLEMNSIWGILLLLGGSGLSIVGIAQVVLSIVQKVKGRRG